VSVGFMPVRAISKYNASDAAGLEAWLAQLKDLGLTEANAPSRIYLEQEQIELSSVPIGANMNAVARSYKDGLISEDLLMKISRAAAMQEPPADLDDTENPARSADDDADAERARQRRRERESFLRRFEAALESLDG
jgi:hypothetical protein